MTNLPSFSIRKRHLRVLIIYVHKLYCIINQALSISKWEVVVFVKMCLISSFSSTIEIYRRESE